MTFRSRRLQAVAPALVSARTAALIVATAAMFLGGCSRPGEDAELPIPRTVAVGGASGSELATEQVLRAANGAEPETLDPHRATGVTASNVLRDLFEGLVTEAADGSLIPGAAEAGRSATTGACTRSGSAPTAAGAMATRGGGGLRLCLARSADPKTLSEYSAILYPDPERRRSGQRQSPPVGARRARARRAHSGVRLHSRRRISSACYAFEHLRLSSALHRKVWRGALHAPANLVGMAPSPRRVGRAVPHPPRAQCPLLGRRQHDADGGLVLPVESAESELNRYRANEFDLTYTCPTGQIPWLKKNLPDELRIAPISAATSTASTRANRRQGQHTASPGTGPGARPRRVS